MSKLSDYSKFDHLDSSDDEAEQAQTKKSSPQATKKVALPVPVHPPPTPATSVAAAPPAPAPAVCHFCRVPHSHRFVLEYNGMPIYEWEQSLSEVTLYIKTPPGVVTAADQLECRIAAQHVTVGVRGHVSSSPHGDVPQYFMDEATAGKVEVQSSTWTWERLGDKEGGLLTMELQKAAKGVVWEAACLGPPPRNLRLNNMQLEEEKRRLLLERWQEENPGMDFRDAEFNGGAPDPRTFMGGVSYS